MGRTVFASENIQSYVENLLKAGYWNLGLIIGQTTVQRDYAVHLIRTPEPAEDEVSTEEEEESSPPSAKKKKLKRPESLADADEKWAASHAKQVTRMLPGGLDVIGVFALAPPNMMQAAQTKLRQIMFSMQKVLQKNMTGSEPDVSDRVLLQICSTTKKYTCRTIDVCDIKSTFRPAEWKLQSEHWIKLESNVFVNLKFSVPRVSKNLTFLKQLQNGIYPFVKSVQNGIVLVNNQLRDPSHKLDQSENKSRHGKDRNQSSQPSYTIDFCSERPQCIEEGPIKYENTAKIEIQGKLHIRGYTTSKATVKDAIQVMQQDLVRTLMSRCELLYEDVIDVVEEDPVMKEVYHTPMRVFGKLPGTSLEFCDYMFPDEKPSEVTERIQELLDITVDAESLDRNSERMATENDFEAVKEDEAAMTPDAPKGHFNIGAVFGGIFAMVFAGLSYYLMGEAS